MILRIKQVSDNRIYKRDDYSHIGIGVEMLNLDALRSDEKFILDILHLEDNLLSFLRLYIKNIQNLMFERSDLFVELVGATSDVRNDEVPVIQVLVVCRFLSESIRQEAKHLSSKEGYLGRFLDPLHLNNNSNINLVEMIKHFQFLVLLLLQHILSKFVLLFT